MFNNLIESSSHTREFKRRGSFFLYTVAAYVLLFSAAGVASIYAYDAQLDEQNAEITIVTFVPPDFNVPVRPAAPANPSTPVHNSNPHNIIPSAPVLYESANNPHSAPTAVSTAAVDFPPASPGMVEGPLNNPLSPGPTGPPTTGPGGSGDRAPVEVVAPPPPPTPVRTPAPKRVVQSQRVLNSQALFLPKPSYPLMAKQIRLSGAVNVQVMIDESGRVVSARSVSGHPLLAPGAVQAALQARFSPTLIGETPVKVSGIIVYNFVLQ
ncbi:MAG: TonB family C-terminal domain protein [Acidobacteria bacterium]|nr:TonB family C-terminal domain protein [Acidobacteriota bacterium]